MKSKIMKILSFLLVVSILFLGCSRVKAATCDADKKGALIREANNVKAIYTPHIEVCEVEDACYDKYREGGEEEAFFDSPGEYYPIVEDKYLTVELLNISENFKVNVSHANTSYNEIPTSINYEDTKNGKYSFRYDTSFKTDKFVFTIVGTEKSGCYNEILRVVDLTLPRTNPYYSYVECKDIEEYYLCQPFVSSFDTKLDLLSYSTEIREEKVKRGIEKEGKPTKNNAKEENSLLAPVMIMIGGATIIVASVIVMKGKKRD